MRLLVVLLVVVATLVPTSVAAAATDVTVKGNVIRITMTVDVVGAADEHRSALNGQPLVDHWEQVLRDTWGAAFQQLPYKSCFKLELDVELEARRSDFDATKGNHRIIVGAASGGSFEGTGFDGASETSRSSRTGDGTRSFEHDRDGAIPQDAPPTVVAHEFGHLFGLGDDRRDGAPKPGRDGTMMVGGVAGVDVSVVQRIDQDLVDRIGDAVAKHRANQGKRMPGCVAWKGPIEATVSGGASCTGTESGTVAIGVVDGEASGSADVAGSYTCDGITVATAGGWTLEGTREGDTLVMHVASISGNALITPSCAIEQRFDVEIARDSAEAELTYTAPSGDVYTCSLTLARQREDPSVA